MSHEIISKWATSDEKPPLLTQDQWDATKPWMRDRSDDTAVENGCFFDPAVAAYVCHWIETKCHLYEGEWRGEPLILASTFDQPVEWANVGEMFPNFYDAEGKPEAGVMDFYRARMNWHNGILHEGKIHMDWQFECHCRIYGWQRPAPARWSRKGIKQVRRFRKANVWIAKKNKKTPSLASNASYLTFGDGEQGGKTFICAKDGEQAGKAWDHADKMVAQSEILSSNSTINRTTRKITDDVSWSYLQPMSSSSVRTQDSKEGVSANIIVDEVHVVDRNLMAVVKYAGIARAQALHLEFSTAGRNSDCYGKDEWDRGIRIRHGEEINDAYFFASYHCPQELTIEQMDKDPEKYIRMANPALGSTVGLDEMIPAWEDAKQGSVKDFRDFCTYRLNIWQNSASSWLPPGAWAACEQEFYDSDLKDLPCVMGLDLARRYDLAAAVYAFLAHTDSDGVQKIFLKPRFWCAEEIMEQRAYKVPEMLDWSKQGFITATPGNVIDFRTIERDMRADILGYKCKGIVYDHTYAEMLIQNLTEGVTDAAGNMIVEPLPVGERAFSQGIMSMTGPTTDFENDVKKERLIHDGNPVLDWQAGNAGIKEDNKGNIHVVKESRASFRTVDGIVAAIMARWGLTDCTDFNITSLDYYVDNNLEFI